MSNPQQGPPSGDDWDSKTPWGSNPPRQPPEQPSYPPPYQQPYQQPSYQQPYQQPAPGYPGYVPGPPVQNYMVPAVLVTLFCFLPTGIAAIVFASQVSSKLTMGDYQGAQAAANKAKILSIVSAGVGLLFLLIIVVASASSSSSGY
jgi:hypothetical protein